MRASVKAAFLPFSSKFEGYLPFMYADVKNLVTTGMGNLIDPIGAALALPWKNPDGSLASQQQITDAWNAVKNAGMSQRGGGAYKSVTTIRLDEDGIQQLISGKLDNNEGILRSRFPAYDSWPADAQLALHSMAWALGPAFKYPKFQAAVNQTYPDFTTAAIESHMSDVGNPGLVPRNDANRQLFQNASAVLSQNLDPDVLYYMVQGGIQAAQSAAGGLQAAGAKKRLSRGQVIGGIIVGGLVGAAAYDDYKKKKKGRK